ncbi:MAG: aromatic amino acid ammonia-lyase [Candidatus Falkowbacteria bacterium]
MEKYLDFADFVSLCREQQEISLNDEEIGAVIASRQVLDDILRKNPRKAYYAVNTGIGALLNKRIPLGKIGEFQDNLIMSHACGVGPPLPPEIVRGMMLHMILNLKKGVSGIRLSTLELLIKMFNQDIIPAVPAQGSLGASGDLIPQAHVSLALIGRGKIIRDGRIIDTASVFKDEGIEPARLGAGEAIALLNGTSYMVSFMAFCSAHARALVWLAHIAAALSLAALNGNARAFASEAQAGSYHAGRELSAAYLSELLAADLWPNGRRKLQDAYSLRCAPRVFGSFLETLYGQVFPVVFEEINNFSGNPEIFAAEERIEQGRDNFHGQSLAQTADSLAIALAALAGISERRIEKLLNGSSPGLPPFLTRSGGLNSGLMIAQYAAAALVAENRHLASPASVHSISVAAGQEDFVSMGAIGARRTWQALKNAEYVVAIEFLCAVQALQFRRLARNPAARKIALIADLIRRRLSCLNKDRILADDIEKLFSLVHDHGNDFLTAVSEATGVKIPEEKEEEKE